MRIGRLIEGFVTAVPCFVLAGTFLATWIDPMSIDGGRWVRFGVGIMVLEFVLVHSGAFMSAQKARADWNTIKLLGAAFLMYGLFAGAMAFAFRSWTLFVIYTLVMLSRWMGMFIHPEEAGEEARRRSGLAVAWYLLAIFASVIFPWPELGVTGRIIAEVYPDRGSGEWERNPETALAAGVIYFTLIGATELVGAWRSARWHEVSSDQSGQSA